MIIQNFYEFKPVIREMLALKYSAPFRVEIYIDVSIEKVLNTVCKVMRLSEARLIKTGRNSVKFVTARQTVCWICRKLCGHGSAEIGEKLNRSHSNVIRSILQANGHIKANDPIVTKVITRTLNKLLYEA